MDRAAGLIRVSRPSQVEKGLSLPDQERTIRAFCEATPLLLVELIRSEGVSGKLIDRPDFARIRELVEARVIDVVVVCRIDRMGRRAWIMEQLADWLKGKGVRLLFTDQTFEDSPAGELARGMLGHVAQFEHSQIRERTMKGKAESARTGHLPTIGNLYGFRRITRAESAVIPEYRNRHGHLEIIEHEAAVVRRIFAHAIAGHSIRRTAILLNDAGHRTRAGNRWEAGVIRTLLRNPAFRGEAIYGKRQHRSLDTRSASGRVQVELVPRDPGDWIMVPVPAIVDTEIWHAAQAVFTRHTIAGRPSTTWLLRGLVVCGTCTGKRGLPLHCFGRRISNCFNRPGYTLRLYACSSELRFDTPTCNTRYSPAERLEALVVAAVKRAIRPANLRRVAEARAREIAHATADLPAQIAHSERSLATLDQQSRRLVQLVARGTAVDAVERELAALDRERLVVTGELKSLRHRLAAGESVEKARSRVDEIAAQLAAAVASLPNDPATFQRLVAGLVQVTIRRGEDPEIAVLWWG